VNSADLVLYLVDAQAGLADEDRVFLDAEGMRGRCIAVWNKIDLARAGAPAGYLPVSAVTGEGFRELEEATARFFLCGAYSGNEAVIDSQRQRECLQAAVDALSHVKSGLEEGVALDAVASDLQAALTAFGELSGEITAGDVLDAIFSKFCVGK